LRSVSEISDRSGSGSTRSAFRLKYAWRWLVKQ